MKNNEDFPGSEESDKDEFKGAPRREGDEQEQDFMDRLKRLSDEAEANAEGKGKQSSFDFEENGTEDEPFKPEFAGDLQNPKESYDLFYTIRRLLMKSLPAGPDNQKLRQMVYDEKNLFLRQGVDRPTDGSKVGADSRQSLLSFLRESFTVTQDWANHNGTAYDIFLSYYELNKKMRFR
ncbi:hypothetical protein [Hymenobacter sp.]|uniref:hypothetical protein n=1 Tax=Hymenobacter sp. TaxID=1898978 RepID=UPI00286A4E49|nr:hypothetical protein [Hymenobacter sp.]